MSIPAPRRAAQTALLLLSFLFVLVPDVLVADEIEVSGLDGSRAKAKVGKAFESKDWTVSGRVGWERGAEEGSIVPALAGGAAIERSVAIPALAGDKVDLAQWRALIAIDFMTAPGRAARGELQLTLEGPGGAASFGRRQRSAKPGVLERLLLPIPAAELVAGDWRLVIRSSGKATVLVTDVAILRLPIAPEAMKFAKSNGVNGPDRLESGALGFVGWTAHRHAPLPVVMVREGSPAAKAGLQPGDVVVAVDGRPLPRSSCKPGLDWFARGHEAVLGRAVEAALEGSAPRVELGILRGDQTSDLELRLEARKPLPQDFPFDREVTPKLYDDLMDFVRRTRRQEGHWQNGGNDWIQTCFAGLALLGRRDPKDADVIREIADWYLAKFPDRESFGNLGFWSAAYSGIFMCEYLLASGDERVRPFIDRALRYVEAGFHTSKWGTPALGHGPSGLPYGQKALMAPASHVIVFEALARKAGFESRIWETLLPYMVSAWSDPETKGGHGAMGYNASYRDKDEFWSRSGLFALASVLRDEKKAMRRALVSVMVERCSYMRNSHAYGNPGDVWGLLGLAAADREAFAEVMRAWRWSFGGAWEPGYGLRHTTAHMGSPYMGEEGLLNPSMAALLAVRDESLFMLGAPDEDRGWLKTAPRSAPDTPIAIRRDREGLVRLDAVLPARGIRYSLDGSPPTRRSALFEAPFALPEGGLVLARPVLGDGELGAVSRASLGLPKTDWKVLAATGSAQEKDAIARAAALIDGDPDSPWQPDRGEGAPEPPFMVMIDMGAPQRFSGLRFLGRHRPEKLHVSFADSPSGFRHEATAFELADEADSIDLGALVAARYLHLAIEKPGKARFGELELVTPAITVERMDGLLLLSTPAKDLVIRVSDDDEAPTAKSRAAGERLKPRKGRCLKARLFTAEGVAVGPVVTIPAE